VPLEKHFSKLFNRDNPAISKKKIKKKSIHNHYIKNSLTNLKKLKQI